MPGRLWVSSDTISQAVALQDYPVQQLPDFQPSFNLTPQQNIPVLCKTTAGKRRLAAFHWGLVPPWAGDRSISTKTVNARSETINEKAAFREAARGKRCVIAIGGYFEWLELVSGGQKIPYCIRPKSEDCFAFAGLYETWQDAEGNKLRSCAVITRPPMPPIAAIHHRQPVILRHDAIDDWLNLENPTQSITADLQYQLDQQQEVVCYPVEDLVNNVRNNTAENIRQRVTSTEPDQQSLI